MHTFAKTFDEGLPRIRIARIGFENKKSFSTALRQKSVYLGCNCCTSFVEDSDGT